MADANDRDATGKRCKHSHVCWQCRERCGVGAKFCRNTAAAGDGGGRRSGRSEGWRAHSRRSVVAKLRKDRSQASTANEREEHFIGGFSYAQALYHEEQEPQLEEGTHDVEDGASNGTIESDTDDTLPADRHFEHFTHRQADPLSRPFSLKDLEEFQGSGTHLYYILVEIFAGLSPFATVLNRTAADVDKPLVHIAIDTDPDARGNVRLRFPRASIWRDFDDLQPKKIYKVLKAVFQPALEEYKAKHGRSLQLEICVTAGPPCRHISRIRGQAAAQLDATEGRLMLRFWNWVDELAKLIVADHWRIIPFAEMTITTNQDTADILHSRAAAALTDTEVVANQGGAKVKGFLVDPMHIMAGPSVPNYSRPRLFWTPVDLETHGRASELVFSALEGGSYTVVNIPQRGFEADIADVTHPGRDGEWSLHESVSDYGNSANITSTKFIGCLTTPAPDNKGRALPPGRVENDFPATAICRWKQDGQVFAPWRYLEQNLMWRWNEHKGNHEWRSFSPEVTEMIHYFEKGTTEKGTTTAGSGPPWQYREFHLSWKARLRLVANSWHQGVAAHLAEAYLDRLRTQRPNGSNQAEPGRPSTVMKRRRTGDGTARDERLKRFDERVDRLNPMSAVELDPWGALMARQAGSGRMGVHEILRGEEASRLERRVLIDDDPEVHLARQSRRITRSSAVGTWTRRYSSH